MLARTLARDLPRSSDALATLGGFLWLTGRPDEAEFFQRQALALRPDDLRTRHALSMTLRDLGQWPEGYALNEIRHLIPEQRAIKPPLPFPEWRGEPLAGKRLLIWPEQGLGDQIQMARFAPLLRSMGADVTLGCHPRLMRLFAGLGVDLVAAEGDMEFPDPDFWVMAMSIPYRLGLTPDTVSGGPYLQAEPRPGLPRIGLAWRGNPLHGNDRFRSFGERPDLPGMSLLPEDTGDRDMLDAAEIISGLDLVISVDTSIAHLAGALGRPCWLLLSSIGADCRWMRGAATPWYDSVRIFRQTEPGSWDGVLDAVRAALKDEALA